MSQNTKSHHPIVNVAKFEIIRQLKKPAFWVAVLLIPILLGGMFLISFLSSSSLADQDFVFNSDTRIAITDEADILPADAPFQTYPNEQQGQQAVKSGEVDIYYYIPADFTESREIRAYRISEGLDISDNSVVGIKNILSEYVGKHVAAVDVVVLSGKYNINETKYTATGETANALGKAIIPLAVLVIFFLFVCIFGNRLLMTVVEEKENRISEMILTAVSAKHLIIGKIFAMMTLGLIQILSFVIPVIILVILNRDNPLISQVLSIIELNPFIIITSTLLCVFSLLFFTGLCTFIGTLAPTARDASQFAAPVIIGVMIPFYVIPAFIASEVNLMVQIFTYFPLSAPTALMLRSAFGNLTPVELYIGLAELIILAVIVIRATVRTFQEHAISSEVVKPKLFR